jgi:uncharacterized protein (DUF952 family)
MRLTFHLAPEAVWREHRSLTEYRPDAFGEDGFIHCTDGEELVLEVANRYYKDDLRPFLLLDVNLDRVSAPVIYEDVERAYPHIYGPMEREAVLRVRRVERGADGTFLAVGETAPEHLP